MTRASEDKLPLDDIGILEGTNKSSLRADYLRHYDEMFAPYRDKKINFIEIGVQNGASLRMWERYFPEAAIIGIDINEKARRFETSRTSIAVGSQADKDFLAAVARKSPPTIVVDDGSHRADHVIFTFEHLFPALEPGGCYVIEDLFLHFGEIAERWRGEATTSPHAYLQRFVPGVLSRLAPGQTHSEDPLIEQIDRFCVVPGAVFIWKRRTMTDVAERIARARALVERSQVASNWFFLTDFIIKNGGPPEEAEHAARCAVRMEPITRSFRMLAHALTSRGDLDGAIAVMEAALATVKRSHEAELVRNTLEKLRDARQDRE